MLELFVVRGQLAVTLFTHATLSAVTWTATILAVAHARRAATQTSPHTLAQDWWARARILSPLATVGALLVTAQLAIFWHPTLTIAGPLLLPLAVSVLCDIVRTILLHQHPTVPSRPRLVATSIIGWLAGTSAVLGLAWLSNPAGADLSTERVVEASSLAAFANATGWLRVLHVTLGALALGTACFAVGAARRSRNEALVFTTRMLVIVLSLQAIVGTISVRSVGKNEPIKLAAMIALWETTAEAPMQIAARPLDFAEQSHEFMAIPGVMSTWVHGDQSPAVEGALETRMENRPPILALHTLFQSKLLLGVLAWVSALVGWVRSNRGDSPRWWLTLTTLPTITLTWTAGWLLAELGRSPWTIRHLLRVGDATWTPYGLAPSGAVWLIGSVALLTVAIKRVRRFEASPSAVEPAAQA